MSSQVAFNAIAFFAHLSGQHGPDPILSGQGGGRRHAGKVTEAGLLAEKRNFDIERAFCRMPPLEKQGCISDQNSKQVKSTGIHRMSPLS